MKNLEVANENFKAKDYALKNTLTGYPSIDKPWLKHYPEGISETDFPKMSLYDYFYESTKDHMNDILIEYIKNKITAEEIHTRIEEFQKAFIKKGITKGDIVGLALANMPESVYAIYALNKIGAIPCNIDPRSNLETLRHDIVNGDVKAFLGINNVYSSVKKIRKEHPLDFVSIVSPLQSAIKKEDKDIKFKLFENVANLKYFFEGNLPLSKKNKYINMFKDSKMVECALASNGGFLMVHTGGTTGVHKGVILSDDALNATVYQHKYLMGDVVAGDTLYNPLPQFMAYGLSTMHLSLCKRLHMYMLPTSSPATFGKEIVELKPNVIYGGPIHYEAGAKSRELQHADLSYVKVAVTGGEKLNISKYNELNQFYWERGIKHDLFDGYGTSEMCGVVSVKRGEVNKAGTVGYPLPFNNAKIVDRETGEELTYGRRGEIVVTGRSMAKGYYNNPEETAKAFKDGWFYTGDFGSIDHDGEIHVEGRYKRQFVCGVDKVYPPIMEEAISHLPFIDQCVVVGVPDEVRRTVPYVYTVLKENYKNKLSENELKKYVTDFVAKSISAEVVPGYVESVDKLLYTPNGKIDFRTLEIQAIAQIKYSENKTKQNVKVKK